MSNNPLAIDTLNRVVNEQEDAIAELKHKLLDMTDERDTAIEKSLKLVQVLKRIECITDWHSGDCQSIARRAIDDFQGK